MPGGGGIHFPLGEVAPSPGAGLALPVTSKSTLDPARLRRPLSDLAGVGKVTARRLNDLGLHTVGDLLLHVPFRHEPPARMVPVGALRADEDSTVRARVVSSGVRSTRRRGLNVLEALLDDGTGQVVALWYNQGYLQNALARRPEVLVRGTLTRRGGLSRLVVRSHEIIGEADEEGVHTLGLVPVYPSTGDLSVRTLRTVLRAAQGEAVHFLDPVPAWLLAAKRLPGKPEALLAFHFPRTLREASRARTRLAFEELLLLQIAVLSRRRGEDEGRHAARLGTPGVITGPFLASLPFRPTTAQRRVMGEIDADLDRDVPMRRLLQGDVGSGKTLVATYCLLRAVEAGYQAALMAPTEVLAEQHATRLAAELAPLGVEVGLLRGSLSAAARRPLMDALADGRLRLVVGTQALIQEGVRFKRLASVVVDEQHRFGVRQRDVLAAATDGVWPHVLYMTATPIPRTLSLTLYGDLDLSVIDELPPGRTPVRTRLVFPEQRERAWAFVRDHLDQGRQAYVVCPLVEESEAVEEASAKALYEELTHGELHGYPVRLLHGQLSSAVKSEVMSAFACGEAAALVATTVIEVGVDVANATVMVIMGSRRFGLSQLHQLRGRVGRGDAASHCLLIVDREEGDALERLSLFARTSDGFALAEADLRLRGEGQLFGERQSGLGDLRVARLLQDGALLEEARGTALALLEEDPLLQEPAHRLLAEAAEERFGGRSHWLDRA